MVFTMNRHTMALSKADLSRVLLLLIITISSIAHAQGGMRPPSFINRQHRNGFLQSLTEPSPMDRDLQRQLLAMATPIQESSSHGRQMYQWNDDNVGMDLKDYAFKYVGCSNVHTFSDDKAADSSSSSVFVMNRFVILRLCRADYCSNYHPMGCQFGYGEYIIAMEDYLSAMARYHYVRYQSYCETCEECMNPDNSDAANEDNEDNDASTNDAVNATEYCEYYDVCFNYMDACKYFNDDAEKYESFFSCAANPYGNKDGYLGPHCRSDGYTIGIGIYSDSDCGDYLGDMQTVEKYTGVSFNDSALELYTAKGCISCKDADEFDLYTDDARGDSLYQLCGVLWDGSAKCNKYLDSDGTKAYESSEEAAEAELVCNFIDSLSEKTYDESGHIVLKSESFDFAKWNDKNEYRKFAQTVKGTNRVELAAVALSALLCLFLLCYSWYLRHKLYKRLLWRPTLRQPASVHGGPRSVSRINSGITMERSFSGETFFRKGVIA